MLQDIAPEDSVMYVDVCRNVAKPILIRKANEGNFHCKPGIVEGNNILPSKRKVDCLGFDSHGEVEVQRKSCFPVDTVLYWHTAIKKELTHLIDEAKKLQSTMGTDFSGFCDCFHILVEACIFRR